MESIYLRDLERSEQLAQGPTLLKTERLSSGYEEEAERACLDQVKSLVVIAFVSVYQLLKELQPIQGLSI